MQGGCANFLSGASDHCTSTRREWSRKICCKGDAADSINRILKHYKTHAPVKIALLRPFAFLFVTKFFGIGSIIESTAEALPPLAHGIKIIDFFGQSSFATASCFCQFSETAYSFVNHKRVDSKELMNKNWHKKNDFSKEMRVRKMPNYEPEPLFFA